jgi:hypothetical protein
LVDALAPIGRKRRLEALFGLLVGARIDAFGAVVKACRGGDDAKGLNDDSEEAVAWLVRSLGLYDGSEEAVAFTTAQRRLSLGLYDRLACTTARKQLLLGLVIAWLGGSLAFTRGTVNQL